MEEEGEESTAVLFPQLDLLREVSIIGGEQRHLGQLAAMAPLGLGLLQQGEKEGEEEQVVVGVAFILQGGQDARERRWRLWWGAAMAPVLLLSPQ